MPALPTVYIIPYNPAYVGLFKTVNVVSSLVGMVPQQIKIVNYVGVQAPNHEYPTVMQSGPVDTIIAGLPTIYLLYYPVLQYTFAGASSLPSWINFSRTSLATMFDSTGALTYAPNNLAYPSNVFTTNWTNNAITVTTGIVDPFGGTTASTLTATGNAAYIYLGYTGVPSNILCSFWVRRRTGTGVVSIDKPNNSSRTTIPVTSTWTQFWIYGPSSAGTSYLQIYLATSGDAVDVYGSTFSVITYETSPRPGDQVITGAGVYYGPRFDYNPSTLAPNGLLVEATRTNLFLNSNTPATQTITVASGSAYSISFYGAGTLTLSGALTQTMTGASNFPARTTYTGTTATTSLTVTVTTLGTMEYPQLELGAFPTSYIPTAASSIARAADVAALAAPASTIAASGVVIAETKNESTGVIARTYYTPGTFSFATGYWYRSMSVYNFPSLPASIQTQKLVVGAPY